MISLVYVSSATEPFSPAELVTLLEKARRNNATLGVTGMLLYKDGNFMQAIEGDDVVIKELHDRIQRDPRHRGMITLLRKPIEQRQFPNWSMGFVDLLDPVVRDLPGYNEFLDTPLTNLDVFCAHPSRAHKLLMTFKNTI